MSQISYIRCGFPSCKCIFITQHDLNLHRRVHDEWRKSNYGDGWEWDFIENKPELASDLSRVGGKAVLGGREYVLNGKYVRRRVCRL